MMMQATKDKGYSSTLQEVDPASTSSRKVCMILCYIPGNEYYLYVVDVDTDCSDGDGFIPKSPTLRLKGFKGSAFWVLNSTLYIFDGCIYDETSPRHHCNKSVRKLKLDLSRFDLVLDKTKIDEEAAEMLGEMEKSKYCPMAVGTPDGKKILVFSQGARWRRQSLDFELFDVETESWETLPGILSDEDNEFISGYGFISNSIFIARVGGTVVFLDIGLPRHSSSCSWETYTYLCRGGYVSAPVVEEELLMAQYFARLSAQCDEPFYSKWPSFGEASDHSLFFEACTQSITPLTHVKGQHGQFCIIVAAPVTDGGVPYYPVSMDVYSCDIARYRAIEKESHEEDGDDDVQLQLRSPTITLVKNLKYNFKCQPNGTFLFRTVFPYS